MMKFETFKLYTVTIEANEFREEVLKRTYIKDIEVKLVHKESINVETGFNGRVNNFNGYTLEKELALGSILEKDGLELSLVWKDDTPRLSTLILEVV